MPAPLLAAVLAMVACLFLVPLGFPGAWVMIGILTIASAYEEVAWPVLAVLVVVAGLGEVAEFLAVRWSSARYGGSRRAFWGAVVGGGLGVLVGLPVPVPLLGSLLGGILGTFLGAGLVAYRETRRVRHAGRVAWGAVLGRALAAVAKTASALVILVVGAAALLVR